MLCRSRSGLPVSQRPNLSLHSCRLSARFSVLGTRSTYLGPNARICRCALDSSCRVLAGLAITGTESTYLGPNARIYRCVLEPSCRVLAGFAVPGTESTNPGSNTRICRCATEPPSRVLADLPVPGTVYRLWPAMHYWRGQVVVATSAKPRERNAILTPQA